MKPKHLNKETDQLQNGNGDISASLPVLDYLNDNIKKSKSSRRDFLKTMGFTISAATLAASCEIPVRKALPYVNKPVEITPGQALYYASSYFDGSSFANIIVKTRDGRPIKVDGNPDSPITKGAANAAVQASVISLYDHTRYKSPMIKGEDSSWSNVISTLQSDLEKASGKKYLITGPVISPSLKAAIASFKEKFGVEHVVYSADFNDALLQANEQTFGKKAAPTYRFDQANVIASFSADFLGSWLGGDDFYSVDYSKGRKVSAENRSMSKHYQVDSYLSLTGSNADKRLTVQPSQVKATIFQLYNLIAGKLGGASVSGVPTTENAFLTELAADLISNQGKSLVVSGINDVEAQKAVNAMNSMLGNYGSTIDFSRTLNFIQADNFTTVANDIVNGRVGAVLMHGVNPVYSSPFGAKLAEGLKKVGVVASFDMAPSETSAYATHVLPDSHYLESWADYEPVTGSFAIGQPTIRTIFNTQEFGQSLLQLAGNASEDYREFIQSTWKANFGDSNFNQLWTDAVGAGSKHNESVDAVSVSANVGGLTFTAPKSSDLEVVVFEDKLGDGKHATNPYLQELPDPVSKVSWGNYAAVSPAFARANGWHKFNRNVYPGNEKVPVLKVTSNNASVEVPLLIQPGMANNTIAIPAGYGRMSSGLVAEGIGANGFTLTKSENGLVQNFAPASFEVTGKKEEVAQQQIHYTIPEDRITVKETTLEEFKKNPKAGNEDRFLSNFRNAVDVTLYPEHDFPGHHWGMSIDLNACYGCGSCVVACNIENNVPVVGKQEVANQRDMSWLRIDRYFASEDQDPKSDTYLEDPSVVFMPMMCQHCDNAPCENVCPVNATNHSSEGLNQMAYNRCIGTRYCANNCPFKVRRFNWFDYWGADAWGPSNDLKKDKATVEMRNDLSRMILNPDVTVRSRGVIEKCSFCVQRIQEKKLDAKLKGEALDANAVKTACQVACATDAIIFGDTNNKESDVHQLQNSDRSYFVLEEFHVLPSVSYLTKVTNSDKALFNHMDASHFVGHGAAEHGESHGGEHGNGHGEEHETETHDDGHNSGH